MLILGLTGSIGMGKSATAAIFRSLGVPVHDSDAAVHELYAGSAAALIEAAFPGVVQDGVVLRDRLGPKVLGDREAMRKLESIIHPLVAQHRRAFLERCRQDGYSVVVFDIPLLFETRTQDMVDLVVVVSAPAQIQRQRVLQRPGMTEEKFRSIMSRQVPDEEKRRRAHYIIDTSVSLESAQAQVSDLLRSIAAA